jgi:mannonate dehydratase
MKLGFGLYRHMLNKKHFRFARQCGATHVVIHLTDYFRKTDAINNSDNQPVGGSTGWGLSVAKDEIWSLESLKSIRMEINAEGLELEAVENFEPADWHDILLDGPKKLEQIEWLKQIIRNMGKVGIPIMGYNFSIAGVASRISSDFARGGAESVGMNGEDQTPIPNGMVWNMVYDQHANSGVIDKFSHEELWQRLDWFLKQIIPVAEEAGVRLAAHPDDPPMPYVRNTPRLVYQPILYQKLLDLHPSPNNSLEYCLGSLAEMTEGNIYEATEHYASQNAIGYIHFRNVKDKVPQYKETFIDEGDIDMHRIIGILKKNNYSGVLIPDHTPLMTCNAPWHAGMAYAMGYMKALLKEIQ